MDNASILNKMRNNKKPITKTILIVGILLIALINYTSAFAVSSKYYEGNPLYVSPGEKLEFQLILQTSGEENVQVTAELTRSLDIIKLTNPNNIYTIIPGERTSVNIEVNIPQDAEPEQVYPFIIRFTTLSTKDAGAVGIGSSIGQGFSIIVGPPQTQEEIQESPVTESPYKWLIYAMIAIIIILIIIFFVKRKKQNPTNFK